MVRSKLEENLDAALKEIFPHETILEDWPIKVRGRTLYVDRVAKSQRLAFEVDGSQHGEFTKRFHGDAAGFRNSVQRDLLKTEWLEQNGFTLIRFAHDEEISAKTLRKKILGA